MSKEKDFIVEYRYLIAFKAASQEEAERKAEEGVSGLIVDNSEVLDVRDLPLAN